MVRQPDPVSFVLCTDIFGRGAVTCRGPHRRFSLQTTPLPRYKSPVEPIQFSTTLTRLSELAASDVAPARPTTRALPTIGGSR